MSVYMQVRREIGLKQPQLLLDESKPVLRDEYGRVAQASYLPSPPLRSFIHAYRFFDLDAAPAYTVPAWTRNTMLFQFGDIFQAYFPDGRAAPRLRTSLLGATTGPLSYGGAEGRYRFVAVEFVPAVMHGLFREPAGAFTNCMVDGGAFYGTQAMDLVIEQLVGASTSETRCAVLDRFFESRLAGADVTVDPGISEVIGHIDTNRGPISMGLLVQTSGISERTLRRRFKAATGLPPQSYHTIRRVERALGFIYHMPGAATIDIITACGFSDQVHLTHEVRRFTLATRSELQRDSNVGPGPLRDFFPHPF